MLHIFKMNGHRCAYDTVNDVSYPLSALALKIIDGLTPPLTEECPSALRYAYAKYDSRDLSEAYAELYALYKKGLLFAEEAEMPTPNAPCTVLHTSAAAADAKIQSAIADGTKALRVYVTDTTVCRLTTLKETYGDRVALTLVANLLPEALSSEDITVLNQIGCYIALPSSEAGFTPSILALADRGAAYIDMELPTSETAQKELQKLAKEIERRTEDGKPFAFGPFAFATVMENGYTVTSPACADCWARAICGGKHLTAPDAQGPACANAKLAIECAVALREVE